MLFHFYLDGSQVATMAAEDATEAATIASDIGADNDAECDFERATCGSCGEDEPLHQDCFGALRCSECDEPCPGCHQEGPGEN